MKRTSDSTAMPPKRTTPVEGPDPWAEKPPPCRRCDSIGMLIISNSQVVDGNKIRYTSAARCSCGWGRHYRGLPLYDSLVGTSPTDDHASLYRAELLLWHSGELAAEFLRLLAEAHAGKTSRIADIITYMTSKYTGWTNSRSKPQEPHVAPPQPLMAKPPPPEDADEVLPF